MSVTKAMAAKRLGMKLSEVVSTTPVPDVGTLIVTHDGSQTLMRYDDSLEFGWAPPAAEAVVEDLVDEDGDGGDPDDDKPPAEVAKKTAPAKKAAKKAAA